MDSIDSTDWRKQLDHQLWASRIRQLRAELVKERENPAQVQLPSKPTDTPRQLTLPSRPVVNT